MLVVICTVCCTVSILVFVLIVHTFSVSYQLCDRISTLISQLTEQFVVFLKYLVLKFYKAIHQFPIYSYTHLIDEFD
jgi:uncharacterized protein YggT (Ycf19 family)